MKKQILIALIFCAFQSFAQEKVKLKIDNPQPRVGQEVTISFDIDFLSNFFQNDLDKNIEVTEANSLFGGSSDKFSRVIKFSKAKTYTIGPFEYSFNGKKYKTTSITVKVLPKLPIKEGLWVRLSKFQGEQYLILEQMIKNTSDKVNNSNGGYSHTIGGVRPEDSEFADIRIKKKDGIQIVFKQSSTSTVTPENADVFDIGFAYSKRQYKVKFDENFSGSYILTKKDINNLPKVFFMGEIELKKE